MLLIALVLAASTPMKIGLVGLRGVGLEDKQLAFFTEHLGQELSRHGAKATSPDEISTMLGFERQKQLLACGDSSCAAELAGALGVDVIVTGTAARVGQIIQLDVKALDAVDGRRRASFSARVPSEEQLLAKLDEAAESLMQQLDPRAAPPAGEVRMSASGRSWAWLPAIIAGVAVAAVGVGFLADAASKYGRLTGATPQMSLDLMTAQQLRSQGSLEQTVGWIAASVGAAALVAGVALLLTRPGEPAVALVPSLDGVGLAGVFP